MAITFGKLEGQITVPTGGWDTTVGGGTATIPAGTYYLSSVGSGGNDFLAEVASQFGTAAATSCTCTASLGENGTGIVTITFGSATAVTWVDTEVRDILGYAGNLSSGTSHVSTKHARGVWLPNRPYITLNGGGTWAGWYESDYRSVENSAGYVWAHMGQYKTVNAIEWHSIKRARTWVANESTTNESYERFFLDCIWGTMSGGTPGGPVRFYPDADTDGTYSTYRLVDLKEFRPEQYSENWTGTWNISLPRMVKVPS